MFEIHITPSVSTLTILLETLPNIQSVQLLIGHSKVVLQNVPCVLIKVVILGRR